MKKSIFLFLALTVLTYVVLADEFVPSPEPDIFTPPQWLKAILLYLHSIPGMGPVVVLVLKWLGVIASALTALVTAFFAIVRSLTVVLNLAGLVALAQKVDAIYVRIVPYLKYLSMYNTQQHELKKGL